jgi:putative serine protease PepD
MKSVSRAGTFMVGLVLGVAGLVTIALLQGHHNSATKTTPTKLTSLKTTSTTDPDVAKRVYAETKDSVAYISATQAQGQATGSGFVVSDDGKIITNEHVVDGAQQVTVKLGTSGTELPAQVLAADASKDLALLQVDANGKSLHPLTLGDSSKVQVGDTVFAIGNPYGLDHTFTSGIISALNREIQAPDGTPIDGALQTDAAINPGNSGGALLDANGDVIGVNSQIAGANSSGGESGNVGIGFAIASNTVRDFVAHPTSSQSQSQSQDQTQQDPNADPYGQQQDPYGQQQDPYSQQDPNADPYGQGLVIP